MATVSDKRCIFCRALYSVQYDFCLIFCGQSGTVVAGIYGQDFDNSRQRLAAHSLSKLHISQIYI